MNYMDYAKREYSDDEKKRRSKFADALDNVVELAKNVPSSGWDVPINYIRNECEKWANDYRRN